jgi:hypothetical protein
MSISLERVQHVLEESPNNDRDALLCLKRARYSCGASPTNNREIKKGSDGSRAPRAMSAAMRPTTGLSLNWRTP